MSRHAAPVSVEERARLGNLGSAVVAAAVTVLLVMPPLFGRIGLVGSIAVLQALICYAWIVGTGVPGRVGAVLITLGAAAGCDTLMYLHPHAGLTPILDVYAVLLVVAIVHQLCRGVVRVRVTESLASVLSMCAAVSAAASYLALEESTYGSALVTASATAVGLAMIAGHLVDAVAPVPHFDTEVPRGLLAVIVSTLVGAGAAWLRLDQSTASVHQYGGLLLGGCLGLLVALVGIGLAYISESTRPRRAPLAGLVLPFLRVGVPAAFAGPVAYFLGLAVTS